MTNDLMGHCSQVCHLHNHIKLLLPTNQYSVQTGCGVQQDGSDYLDRRFCVVLISRMAFPGVHHMLARPRMLIYVLLGIGRTTADSAFSPCAWPNILFTGGALKVRAAEFNLYF